MSAVHARKLADIIVAYQQDPERFVGTAGLVGTVSAAACGAVCGNFIDAAASAVVVPSSAAPLPRGHRARGDAGRFR